MVSVCPCQDCLSCIFSLEPFSLLQSLIILHDYHLSSISVKAFLRNCALLYYMVLLVEPPPTFPFNVVSLHYLLDRLSDVMKKNLVEGITSLHLEKQILLPLMPKLQMVRRMSLAWRSRHCLRSPHTVLVISQEYSSHYIQSQQHVMDLYGCCNCFGNKVILIYRASARKPDFRNLEFHQECCQGYVILYL